MFCLGNMNYFLCWQCCIQVIYFRYLLINSIFSYTFFSLFPIAPSPTQKDCFSSLTRESWSPPTEHWHWNMKGINKKSPKMGKCGNKNFCCCWDSLKSGRGPEGWAISSCRQFFSCYRTWLLRGTWATEKIGSCKELTKGHWEVQSYNRYLQIWQENLALENLIERTELY